MDKEEQELREYFMEKHKIVKNLDNREILVRADVDKVMKQLEEKKKKSKRNMCREAWLFTYEKTRANALQIAKALELEKDEAEMLILGMMDSDLLAKNRDYYVTMPVTEENASLMGEGGKFPLDVSRVTEMYIFRYDAFFREVPEPNPTYKPSQKD